MIPVELVDFRGAFDRDLRVILSWQTASEVNNKGFQIEKQAFQGNVWLPLGFVQAMGKAARYDFVDKTPLKVNYYRLRQIDFDGQETLSKVIAVAKEGVQTLKAFPTIVTDGILHLEGLENASNTSRWSSGFGEEGGTFLIYNMLGQLVLTGKTMPQLDVSALPQGTLILKIGFEQVKFVKQ